MLTKESLLVRSLLFALATSAVAACSGGSNSPALPSASAGSIAQSTAVQAGPSLIRVNGGGGACTTSNFATLTSQPAAGDLIVIYAELNSTAASLTAPAGFAVKDTKNGGWFQSAEYYKIASGTEGDRYSIGSNCGGHALTWVIAEVRGENQSAPFDFHSSVVNATTHITSFTTASLTPSGANDLPIAVIAPGSNGLRVSSVSPANWTTWANGAYYTQKLFTGPLTGTTAISFSETTSSATKWASLQTLDLIASSGSSVTSAPAATATPTATAVPIITTTPVPAPTPGTSDSAYTYAGCVVYGPNDWFTTNLITGGSAYASNTVDPNSDAMLSNLDTAYPGLKLSMNASSPSVNLQYGPANVATSATGMYTIQGLLQPLIDDPSGDDTNSTIPWQSDFHSQGSCTSYGDDCHSIVVTSAAGGPPGTQPCVDYETYNGNGQWSWNGSSFSTHYAFVHNLSEPFNTQYAQDAGIITKAGLPLLGTMELGEDASLPSINHIALLVLPGSDSNSGAVGGYVAPASAGTSCVSINGSSCTHALPMGARLRLKSSYTCPSAASYPQANKICVQLKTYGAIAMDHGATGSTYGIPLGPKQDDTNPWNPTDIGQLNGIPIAAFDVMSVGTVH